MKEIKNWYDDQIISTPTVHCTVFEDNSGAIELVNVPKMRPRTKHINIKYHFFREYVRTKMIAIQAVTSQNQIADYLTKPLPREDFQRHRKLLQGW